MKYRQDLYVTAGKFHLTRWGVIKMMGSWVACDPAYDAGGLSSFEKDFETFAEAIEYAQKQARQ